MCIEGRLRRTDVFKSQHVLYHIHALVAKFWTATFILKSDVVQEACTVQRRLNQWDKCPGSGPFR